MEVAIRTIAVFSASISVVCDFIDRFANAIRCHMRTRSAPATRHELSVHTFSIVTLESMLVMVQFLLLEEYYNSELLWRSHQPVATANAGKWHKTDLRYSEIEAISVRYKFCNYCELRAETMPLEGRYPVPKKVPCLRFFGSFSDFISASLESEN